MERKNEITELIHRAYDELKESNCLRYDSSLAIIPGVFIDPGLSSAEAKKIVSFVHGYEGNPNNCIISVSDVYCQKVWVVCYPCAKLLIEGGMFAFENNIAVLTGNYHLSDESKMMIFRECAEFMKAKKEHLEKGTKDISNKLIEDLYKYDDPDKDNSILKYEVTANIAFYAIQMLILHEYSHIYNNDCNDNKTNLPLHVRRLNEKRADIDAFAGLINNNYLLPSYLGALCLQSSGLFLNATIEDGFTTHPDVDERIEYIFSSFPKEEECDVYFTDVLELFVYLWSVLNNREDAFREIGQECSSARLFDFLKKEKKIQSDKRNEEGRAENARRVQDYYNRKGMKLPD